MNFCSRSADCTVETSIDFWFADAAVVPEFTISSIDGTTTIDGTETDTDGWWNLQGCFPAEAVIEVQAKSISCHCDPDTTDEVGDCESCKCKMGHTGLSEGACTPIQYECTNQQITISNAVRVPSWRIREVRLFLSKDGRPVNYTDCNSAPNCKEGGELLEDGVCRIHSGLTTTASSHMSEHHSDNAIDDDTTRSSYDSDKISDYQHSEFWSDCENDGCIAGEVWLQITADLSSAPAKCAAGSILDTKSICPF